MFIMGESSPFVQCNGSRDLGRRNEVLDGGAGGGLTEML